MLLLVILMLVLLLRPFICTRKPALRALCPISSDICSLTPQEEQMSASQPLVLLLRLLDGHAAVYGDDLSCNIASLIACQEGHCFRNIFGCAYALQWNLC